MDVAVVVRRSFDELSVLVAVALGDLDQPGRLEHEVALFSYRVKTVSGAARNDDVIALLVRHVAERRLQRARAFVDEDHLVAFAVAEEVVHLLLGPAERYLDVVVPHEHAPPGDLVALGLHVAGLEVAVRMLVGQPFVALDLLEPVELHHATRRLQVVQDRLVAGEALEAHHLLGEERSVLPELDVALARDLA
jgi:hypothetical protein